MKTMKPRVEKLAVGPTKHQSKRLSLKGRANSEVFVIIRVALLLALCVVSTSAASLRKRSSNNDAIHTRSLQEEAEDRLDEDYQSFERDITGVIKVTTYRDPNATLTREEELQHLLKPRIVGGTTVARNSTLR